MRPKHRDAKHNLGVLTIGVGRWEEALPLFKVALEANPNIEQLWLSYIDSLIMNHKLDDAKQVIKQCREAGFRGYLLSYNFTGRLRSITLIMTWGWEIPHWCCPKCKLLSE